jgi:hypothetical protein
MFYTQFLGTLPVITGLLYSVSNVRILIEVRSIIGNSECLWEGPVGILATVAAGTVTEQRILLTELPVIIRLAGACNETTISGSFTTSAGFRLTLV